MIGVVQEAQFPKFDRRARRLAKRLKKTGNKTLQSDFFDDRVLKHHKLDELRRSEDRKHPEVRVQEHTMRLLEVYAHAHRDKRLFDRLLNDLAQKTGSVPLIVPLKGISRVCEKMLFK